MHPMLYTSCGFPDAEAESKPKWEAYPIFRAISITRSTVSLLDLREVSLLRILDTVDMDTPVSRAMSFNLIAIGCFQGDRFLKIESKYIRFCNYIWIRFQVVVQMLSNYCLVLQKSKENICNYSYFTNQSSRCTVSE